MDQDWQFYFDQLAGKNPELTPGNPQAGYYRTRSSEAVVIWRAAGELFAQKTTRNGMVSLLRDADVIDELFSKVCRNPVAGDVYTRFVETSTWPEDIERPAERGIGDNMAGLTPSQRISAEINDLLDSARAWLKGIGKVATQEHADKAANYADAFAELEKKATDAREELKRPVLEEGRRIDREWKPVEAAADNAKREFKAATTPYLLEKKKRLQEEERLAREEAAEKGEIFQHRPSGTVAGTRGSRVALRTVKSLVVTDMKAVAQFYLSMETLPREIEDAIRTCAKRALEGGAQIPGCNLLTEQKAA